MYIVSAALIYNETDETWHPVLFREAPLPSGHSRRLKSKGHHTQGFKTREEAVAWYEKEKPSNEYTKHTVPCFDVVFPWDGEGVPALTAYADEDGRLIG